jgi:HK97 family phage major capsid protein
MPTATHPLDHRISTLNDRIEQARASAQSLWASFERERSALAASGDDDATALSRAESAHGAYEATARELEELEGQRQRTWQMVPGRGHRQSHAGRRHGEPYEPGEWLHGEISRMAETYAIGSGAGVGAAVTPVDQPDAFFDLLAPQSVGLASGFSVLPTERGEVHVPRVTEDSLASWTLEGQPITESEPDGDTIEAKPRKLAGLTMLNNEVVKDSSPAALAIAERSLLRSVSLKLDLGFFEGTGVAPQIRGVANTSGIRVIDMGANGAAIASLDPFIDAIAALEDADAEASAIVMAPRTWKALMKLRETSDSLKPLIDPTGNGTDRPRRSILGVPVFVTSQLKTDEAHGTSNVASSAYVYEARQVVAVRRQDAEIVVAPLAGFNTDQTGVRVIVRYDLAVPNPAAVCRIEGIVP